MVVDAVSAFTGIRADDIKVEIEPQLAIEVSQRLQEARSERLHADQLASAAADKLRQVARTLAEDGLPERDIGSILGVSHQRAHQLLTDRKAS
jgi:hypothetical protein